MGWLNRHLISKMARISKDYKNYRCDAMVGGKAYHFESLLEYRWAQYLEFLVQAGHIVSWEYESPDCRFIMSPFGKGYLLDFVTQDQKGQKEWYECKGYIERRDVTRFRQISKAYPKAKINLVIDRIPKRRAQNYWSCKKYVYRIIEAHRIFKQVPIDMGKPLQISDEQPGRRKGAL